LKLTANFGLAKVQDKLYRVLQSLASLGKLWFIASGSVILSSGDAAKLIKRKLGVYKLLKRYFELLSAFRGFYSRNQYYV